MERFSNTTETNTLIGSTTSWAADKDNQWVVTNDQEAQAQGRGSGNLNR
jgi:hypothetical protein